MNLLTCYMWLASAYLKFPQSGFEIIVPSLVGKINALGLNKIFKGAERYKRVDSIEQLFKRVQDGPGAS